MHAFLLTYRTFISPQELFDALVSRYNLTPANKELSHEEFDVFYTSVLRHVRLRVTQVLKKWIDEHFEDFKQDHNMIAKCREFIDEMKRTEQTTSANQLLKALTKKIEMKERRSLIDNVEGISTDESISDQLLTDAKFLAQQVTLLEHDIFKKVREVELVNKNWSRPNRQSLSPHISELAKWFNRMSNYVASRILLEDDIEKRKDTLTLMIEFGHEMYLINNFNGVFEVCSALESSSIHRLKKTWARIDASVKNKFKEMKGIISGSNNFACIRERVRSVPPPCLPYIGIYLTDLTFIEDGNSDELNGKVNFIKRKKLAGVISDIKIYQQTPYKFEYDEQAQHYLKHLSSPYSKDGMYSRSLELEPREKKQQQLVNNNPT